MTSTQGSILRSVLAVLAGFLTMFLGVTTVLAFIMFIFIGDFPTEPAPYTGPAYILVLEIVFSVAVAVGGGYVCALVARRAEIQHGLALAGLMLVLGAVSIYTDAGLKPLWSSIGLAVLSPFGAVFGARLRGRQVGR